MASSCKEPLPVRDAGTLVVARPRRGDGVPELLMTRRSSTMRFAGGAMVFPGGAVDAADRSFAATIGHDEVSDMAMRVAAIRETIEECGLLLTEEQGIATKERVSHIRRALHRGEALETVAKGAGLRFDFDALVPFARWCPRPEQVRIRYDTRFFVAVVDGGYDDLEPDGSETAALLWVSAQDMLDRADAGDAHIIFPTRCNLERLAQCRSVDALVDHARAYRADLIMPFMEDHEGESCVCIPEGLGYPITRRPAHLMRRG